MDQFFMRDDNNNNNNNHDSEEESEKFRWLLNDNDNLLPPLQGSTEFQINMPPQVFFPTGADIQTPIPSTPATDMDYFEPQSENMNKLSDYLQQNPEPPPSPYVKIENQTEVYTNSNSVINNPEMEKIAKSFSEEVIPYVQNLKGNMGEFIRTGNFELLAGLEEGLNGVTQWIQLRQLDLLRIFCENLLSPTDLYSYFMMMQRLDVHNEQLKLLRSQFNFHMGLTTDPINQISLVISSQYFPCYLVKEKQHDPIQLRLLTAAGVDVLKIGPLSVSVICDPDQSKSASGVILSTKHLIEKESTLFDIETLESKYAPKFSTGSNKHFAHFKFQVAVQLGNTSEFVVQSPLSHPFSVLTNESMQYEAGQYTVLRMCLFNTQDSVSWCRFINTLHWYFLRDMRQNLAEIKSIRSWTLGDINYFHSRFFGNATQISVREFDDFWQWFGKSCQKLRFQRPLSQMWTVGYILGFATREQVNELLLNAPVGAFIIRLSEMHVGQLTIAYVIQDEMSPQPEIRHFLVTADDVNGSKKVLPDFLAEWKVFQSCLTISETYKFGSPPRLSWTPKEYISRKFGAKPPSQNRSGYDPQVMGSKEQLKN